MQMTLPTVEEALEKAKAGTQRTCRIMLKNCKKQRKNLCKHLIKLLKILYKQKEGEAQSTTAADNDSSKDEPIDADINQ